MSKDKKNESWLRPILEKLGGDNLEMIGMFVAVYAPLAILGTIFLGGKYLYNLSDTAKKDCWKVERIEGQIYKLDTCTGELKEVKLPSSKQ